MNNQQPLIENIWPLKKSNIRLKNITLIILGTILIAISAKIQVPFWPVPMTMQTFTVFVIAISYGSRLSLMTLSLYLLEGAIGLPVFATGSGIAYLFGPTSGYLFGMLLASGLIGFFGDKGYGKTFFSTLLPLLLGTLIIFLLGVGYLSTLIGPEKAIQGGLLPFIPSEFFKILLAVITINILWKFFNSKN